MPMHAARRLSVRAAVILGVGLEAAPAGADIFGVWESAALQFSNLGRASATATATGLTTLNGSAGLPHLYTLTLPALPAAALNTVIAVTDPIVTAGGVVEVRITNVMPRPDLQGGVFAPISGVKRNTAVQLTQNTMPSTGNLRICLFYAGCNSGSLDLVVGATDNGVYIGAGVGGLLTIGGEGAIRISLLGAPWTIKTVSVSNRTDNGGITFFSKKGFAHGPASLTSSTAATAGAVQLVSATQTVTVGIPGNSDRSGNISSIRLHFIEPEPGLPSLLVAGAAGLALLGRRRMRR
jgi:hypothetical protein